MNPAARQDPPPELPRFMGPFSVAMFTVAYTIGTAIFRVPGEVASGAGSTSLSLVLWIAGAVIALCGGLCYAELAVRIPRSGSDYAYCFAAYGPYVAFLAVWAALFASPAAVAAVARAFTDYFATIWPMAEQERRLFAMATIGTLASVAVVSTRAGTGLAALSGLGKLLAVLGIAVAGLLFSAPAVVPARMASPSADLMHIGPALVAIIFAYDGFATSTLMGAEVREPARSFPLGLVLAIALIALAYLSINSVYFHVLGFEGVAASDAVAAQTLAISVGPQAAQAITVLVMAAALGTLTAQTVGLPRQFLAAASDGLFPPWLARLNARGAAPSNAVIALAAMAMLFQLTGGYIRLIEIGVLIAYPISVIALLGAVRLRRAEGHPADFAMPLYPLPLLVFAGGIGAMWIASVVNDPMVLLYALGVPLSGTIVYVLWLRQR